MGNPPKKKALTHFNESFVSEVLPNFPDVKLGAMSECREVIFNGPNVIEKMTAVGRSTIGSYSNIGVASYVSDSDVGRYCSIGARVSIGGYEHPQDWLGLTSHQWGKNTQQLVSAEAQELLSGNQAPKQPITYVGNDVWIGDNAVIKKSVSIGSGGIVGAGSVVTKDVPEFSIVVGVPARILRFRFPVDLRSAISASKWWDLDLEEIAHLPFSQGL
jgi:virginiamycin A acetyltransferase